MSKKKQNKTKKTCNFFVEVARKYIDITTVKDSRFLISNLTKNAFDNRTYDHNYTIFVEVLVPIIPII